VIVAGSEGLRYVLCWETVGQDVVCRLDVEGFFDFGVGCEEEVGDD
jgi:hypothetical protein